MSNLLATTPAYVPSFKHSSSASVTSNPLNRAVASMPLEDMSSSISWDPNNYFHSTSSSSPPQLTLVPGPVQRPNSSHVSALTVGGTMNSRCIQRPSSESRTSSFSLHSALDYAQDDSTSIWNQPCPTNTHESLWKYSHEPHHDVASTLDDFPLYDPFNSGAGLTIPSSTLLTGDFDGMSSRVSLLDHTSTVASSRLTFTVSSRRLSVSHTHGINHPAEDMSK